MSDVDCVKSQSADFTVIRLLLVAIAVAFIAIVAVSIIGLSDESDATALQFTEGGVKYEVTDDTTNEVKVIANVYTGSIVIPATVEHDSITYSVIAIGDKAFNNCTGLTSVTMPEGLKSIGYLSFRQTSLTTVTIPASVTSITDNPFMKCQSLKEFNVPKNSSSFCSVDGVLYNHDKTSLIAYPADRESTAYTISESVTAIGNQAFYMSKNLVSVKMADNVTTIGSDGFYACIAITSIEMSNKISTIGDWAFNSCSSLTSIVLPAGVTSISEKAFLGCTALGYVNVLGSNPATLGASVFDSGKVLLVPYDSVSVYKGAAGWSSYETSIFAGIDVPAIVNNLVYNGFEQTGLSSFNSVACTATGVLKAKDAGSYTVTVSINDTNTSKWRDGTTEPKTFGWSIAKATPTETDFTFKEPMDLIYNGSEKKAEVSVKEGVTGMGTFTVEYSNNIDVGTCIVTVKIAEGQNFTAGEFVIGSFDIRVNNAANGGTIGIVLIAVVVILSIFACYMFTKKE